MTFREFIGDVIVHAAAGFAETLANKTESGQPSDPTKRAATMIGSQLAKTFASGPEAGEAKEQSDESDVRHPECHPVFTEEQILNERIAVWNYPIDIPLELQRTLNQPLLSKE